MEVGDDCIPHICTFAFRFSYLNVRSLSASCSSGLPLQCHYFVSSMLILSPVFIGSNATVEHTANVEPGAKLMGGSTLDFCSTLPMGWTSSTNTYLCGALAKPVKFVDQPLTRKRDILPILLAPLMIWVYAAALFPEIIIFNFLHSILPNNAAPSTISSAMVYQISLFLCMYMADFVGTLASTCMVIIFKWSLVQRITPGEQSYWKERRMKVGGMLLFVLFSLIFLLNDHCVLQVYEFLVDYTAVLLYCIPHPFQGIYLHLLGCKVKDVVDFSDRESAVQYAKLPLLGKLGELLEVGTGALVNGEDISYRYEDPVTGQVFFHELILGDYTYMGGNSVVGMGVEFKPSSGVGGRSCVHSFSTVQENTISVGNSGQFSMRRPKGDGIISDRVHSSKTPLSWKLIFMLKHFVRALNISVTMVILKVCVFQSFGMLEGYFNPSSVPEFLACAYISFVIGAFLTAVILVMTSHTIYGLSQRLLRGDPGVMNTDLYHSWVYHDVNTLSLYMLIVPYIGSSPLASFMLRLLGSKVGKDLIVDNVAVSGIALNLLSFSVSNHVPSL